MERHYTGEKSRIRILLRNSMRNVTNEKIIAIMINIDIVKDTGISKGAFSSHMSGQYNPKADKMERRYRFFRRGLALVLYGENVPMQTGTGQDMPRPYVFYHNTCSEYLLDRLDDVYIVMMPQCSTLIPHFYVLVNQSMNEMHLLLLCLKEDLQGF